MKIIAITEVNKIVALAAARSILLRMRGSERVFKAQILVSSGRKLLKRDYTNASKYCQNTSILLLARRHASSLWVLQGGSAISQLRPLHAILQAWPCRKWPYFVGNSDSLTKEGVWIHLNVVRDMNISVLLFIARLRSRVFPGKEA